jgi:hypothetical protein
MRTVNRLNWKMRYGLSVCIHAAQSPYDRDQDRGEEVERAAIALVGADDLDTDEIDDERQEK